MVNCLRTNKLLHLADKLPHFHTAHVKVGMRENKKWFTLKSQAQVTQTALP